MEEIGVKWQIRDEITGKRILTDRLELIIIELPKARRMYKINPNNTICQWMLFLDNPNQKEVVQIMKENKDINKAIDELEQVSGNEKLRRIAELKEKYIRDEQALSLIHIYSSTTIFNKFSVFFFLTRKWVNYNKW